MLVDVSAKEAYETAKSIREYISAYHQKQDDQSIQDVFDYYSIELPKSIMERHCVSLERAYELLPPNRPTTREDAIKYLDARNMEWRSSEYNTYNSICNRIMHGVLLAKSSMVDPFELIPKVSLGNDEIEMFMWWKNEISKIN